MKKKLFVCLLLLISLFMITSCKGGSGVVGKKNVFKLGEQTFTFNQDENFKDFHYKTAEGLTSDESNYAKYLDYKNTELYDGLFVFRIVMAYKENSTFKDLSDYPGDDKVETKTYNGIKWKFYKFDNNDNTVVNSFFIEKNNNVYAINIGRYKDAEADLDALSEAFMNGVSLD